MKINDLPKLEQKYFKNRMAPILDEYMIIEEETHKTLVIRLNEMLIEMSRNDQVDFTDQKNIKFILLELIPDAFSFQPDFSGDIYLILLSYYEFLYSQKVIDKTEYCEMLLFFQKNMKNFFVSMVRASNDSSPFEMENFQDDSEQFATPEEVIGLFEAVQKNMAQFPSVNVKPKEAGFVQLRVDLLGFKPPIWRRVIVPGDISFWELHLVIQALFEWKNSHLHQFVTELGKFGNLENDYTNSSEEYLIVEIVKFFRQIDYVYDFGDDWRHQITVEKHLTKKEAKEANMERKAICLKKVKDAPLEDSRGIDKFGNSTLVAINERLDQLKL